MIRLKSSMDYSKAFLYRPLLLALDALDAPANDYLRLSRDEFFRSEDKVFHSEDSGIVDWEKIGRDHPFLGWEAGRLFSPTHLGKLGVSSFFEKTVLSSITSICNRIDYATSSIYLNIHELKEHTQINVLSKKSWDGGLEGHLYFCSAFISLIKLLSNSNLDVHEVRLPSEYNSLLEERILGSGRGVKSVVFGDRTPGLTLPRRFLRKDNPNYCPFRLRDCFLRNPQLKGSNEDILYSVQRFLASRLDDKGFIELRQAHFADYIGLSTKQVSEKLKKKGTSFQAQKNEALKNKAIAYMKTSASLTQVSEELGFSTYSNFSRAFSTWTGLSPRCFMASLASSDSEDQE